MLVIPGGVATAERGCGYSETASLCSGGTERRAAAEGKPWERHLKTA